MSFGSIVSRGIQACPAALVAAVYFFLLFAPTQLASAVTQSLTPRMLTAPGQPPDLQVTMMVLPLACVTWIFLIALIFITPLLNGGMIGRIRDRIEGQPLAKFGSYGRMFYGRLLGSVGLFIACAIVAMLPVMCFGMIMGMQQAAEAMRSGQADPAQIQQMARNLYKQPLYLALMAFSMLAMTVLGLLFHITNAAIVCDGERVMAAWSRSWRFFQENFGAMAGLGLINIGLSIPAGAFGVVSGMMLVESLAVLLAGALVQSVFISCLFVLGAGLSTSLYLARRPAAPGAVSSPSPAGPGQFGSADQTENPYRQPGSQT
jgi:hypothetical protein